MIHIKSNETFADGLKAPFAGELTLMHMQHYVDEMVLVSEEEIIHALWMLMERCKVMPEGAGAAAFAALLSRKFEFPAGATVVCMA